MCLNMRELGETAEALPLMEESNIYGGVGSNEVHVLVDKGGAFSQHLTA